MSECEWQCNSKRCGVARPGCDSLGVRACVGGTGTLTARPTACLADGRCLHPIRGLPSWRCLHLPPPTPVCLNRAARPCVDHPRAWIIDHTYVTQCRDDKPRCQDFHQVATRLPQGLHSVSTRDPALLTHSANLSKTYMAVAITKPKSLPDPRLEASSPLSSAFTLSSEIN